MTMAALRHIAVLIAAGAFGLLFGFGLILSHMADPARVAAFLDFSGAWNPSLAFVMGGAILVAFPAFWYARHHSKALLCDQIELPERGRITKPLILGATIFGIGWGLSGICPGPGLVLLGSLDRQALVFVTAMAVGMLAQKITSKRSNGA